MREGARTGDIGAAIEELADSRAHLAAAVVTAAEEAGVTIAAADRFHSIPGRGVTATVGGRAVQVGSPALITDYTGTPTAYGQGLKNHFATVSN